MDHNDAPGEEHQERTRARSSTPAAAVSIRIRALPPASFRHTWSPCTTGRSRSSTITS
jgi:hypothetical protein